MSMKVPLPDPMPEAMLPVMASVLVSVLPGGVHVMVMFMLPPFIIPGPIWPFMTVPVPKHPLRLPILPKFMLLPLSDVLFCIMLKVNEPSCWFDAVARVADHVPVPGLLAGCDEELLLPPQAVNAIASASVHAAIPYFIMAILLVGMVNIRMPARAAVCPRGRAAARRGESWSQSRERLRYLLIIVKLRSLVYLAACLLLLSACAFASVHQIGPDLYAYVSDNDASANSTFLLSDRGILVVDTGLNAEEGRRLLAEIRKVSPAPVRWIVNTHYHPDHRGGNSVVGANATIISTEYTRERMAQGNASHKGPSVVPRGELRLFVGGHEVRIYHPGPAHTLGDLVVYFPDQRAIATGDLFLTNSCPAMDEGDMENWIAALDHMLALPVEKVVPGHFELAGRTELKRFRDYLAALRDQVAAMYRKGLALDQVKQRISLPAFKDFRQFPKYEATFADNAEAYYRQLQKRGQ